MSAAPGGSQASSHRSAQREGTPVVATEIHSRAVASLSIEDLHVGYGRREVLHGATLPLLHPAHIVALLGPNGSGKSTLLKAVAGLLPSTGTLQLGDTDLRSLKLAERIARVAYLPQSLPTGARLTVLETLLASLRAAGGGRADDVVRAQTVLARLGCGELAMQTLNALSGGQRQLVGLAQALVRDPQALLLDEPLAALDLRHQLRTMRLLREVAAERRIAILVVLHDLNVALRHCDGVVLLKEGRVLAAGSPADAINPAAIAAVYGVQARVEACSRGTLQVLVDDEAAM